jgi:hypothetical protein
VIFNFAPPADFSWVEPAITMLAVFVGGALSYFVTRRLDSGKEKKQALNEAYGLLTVLLRLADDITKIEQHVRECLEQTRAQGAGAPEWMRIVDLVGLDASPIELSPSQIALVSALHDSTLLMNVMEVAAARRILLQRFTKMMHLRDKLAEQGGIVNNEGLAVSFEFSGHGPWTPILLNLHTISKNIALDGGRMRAHSQETMVKIGPALKAHYKFKKFYDLVAVEQT